MSTAKDLRQKVTRQAQMLGMVIYDALPQGFAMGTIRIGIDDQGDASSTVPIMRDRVREDPSPLISDVSYITVHLSESISVEITGGMPKTRQVAERIGADYLTGIMSLTILATEMSASE